MMLKKWLKNMNMSNIIIKIRLILISKEKYVTQRARDVYVTSIFQFKTLFNLSFATQLIKISSKNIAILNKWL
jgi:uncharacterized protein (UPF0305 family)